MQKLRPDVDLQCYFQQPSAVAALSSTSADGFTVSGTWREQSDWAVVEWNRDNVFEHPVFRNLPDGDLSGLQLSYEETRTNCIALDSNLFATVDWPYLRVWADPNDGSGEHIYWIPLRDHAAVADGQYEAATATFTLSGSASVDDYVELVCGAEHFTYKFFGADSLENAIEQIANAVNGVGGNTASPTFTASTSGSSITLTCRNASLGTNGNRVGIYGNVLPSSGAAKQSWSPQSQSLSGGKSPDRWRIDLDFSVVQGHIDSQTGPLVNVPMSAARKMRWTWAADLQPGAFQRSEFGAVISKWTVAGTKRTYRVAGPGSWRVEDVDRTLSYTPSEAWPGWAGNYSGGSIHSTSDRQAAVAYQYSATYPHSLYLGTRRSDQTASISVAVDSRAPQMIDTALQGEDVLVRIWLADLPMGPHSVKITVLSGTFWFDFLEMAVPSGDTPSFLPDATMTLATDWDTLHSQAIAPERTARLIQSLGYAGRANFYIGALWWYELVNTGTCATATVKFSGSTAFGASTRITIGEAPTQTGFSHVNYVGDSPTSIARALELLINEGSTGIWASADDSGTLIITARTRGSSGNLVVAADPGSESLHCAISVTPGLDGEWLTDLRAVPRINRAARDWSRSFLSALHHSGIDGTVAFSMELGNGDSSAAAGIAQRYPDESPCRLNTPALQTNFSPVSLDFWQQAYLDMATVMAEAGLQHYLQFGEVQWWYFCPPKNPKQGDWRPIPNGGMPFYDQYTKDTFQSQFGWPMHVFTDPSDDPTAFPHEASFLPGLIGQFTSAIMSFVRQQYPGARFEVLYPPDTNDAPLTRVINLPATWTPANLDSFKTENFTYTGDRDLNKVRASVALPGTLGFTPEKAAHLIGIGDHSTPWPKETRLASGSRLSSVVLFALDQYCLIGYGLPCSPGSRRSLFMGR
ncbi:MAG: hypothetical protein U0Q18_19990 [Bryobacteraceae bacterium]